ncbi:TRAP transporter substrate-binding protein DctP [Hoeflea poritis]|uniref:TRAP transporter substrate-binding protein DctP n=1 Tax=Hoeflea poritis TaxID=2993659 RepID=A0ABT4VUY7_9HYPH|nr:TRAP transporter substrate-binding protein DctP [Hoeflea poritis]MDA4848532.1 TRAP transporter substrate-binding protein DctP [Hoeflea poritis]
MKLMQFAVAAAVAVGSIAITAPASAEAEFRISYADFGANRGPRAAELVRWADEINKRTDGRVEIEFFWSGSLMKTKDIWQGVKGGVAEMGTVIAAFHPAEFPVWGRATGAMNEPDTWVGIRAWTDLATESELFANELENNGIKVLLHNTGGPMQLVCKDVAPTTVEELQGLKIGASGAVNALLSGVGAASQVISTSETYVALDRGVVDCNVFASAFITSYKLYEITDNVVAWNIYTPYTYGGVVNLEYWNSLPADIQEVIEEVSAEYRDRLAKSVNEQATEVLEQVQAGIDGHTMNVVEMSAEEFDRLRPYNDVYLQEWREKLAEATSAEAVAEFEALHAELMEKYRMERDEKGYPWER